MWRTIYYLIVLTAATYVEGMSQTQPGQVATAYHVFGRCHDNSTAVGLKASVYAVVNQNRQKLAICNDNGIFEVPVPVSATHMVLEMAGYRTVTIPITFTPDIPSEARFSVWDWAMMTPIDSIPKPLSYGQDNLLSLYVAVPDSIDVKTIDYSLTSLTTLKSRWLRLPVNRLTVHTLPISVTPDVYTATLSTGDGQFISKEKIATKPGITFKAVRVGNPVQTRLADKPVWTPVTTVLYFDQSSHELRPRAKNTLDSVAQLLVGQGNLMANVTGYTDNVGDRNLNLSLSEYRARTVENYLKKHGVLANQILAKWKGPDSTASAEDPELTKTKSRRVTIQLVPK